MGQSGQLVGNNVVLNVGSNQSIKGLDNVPHEFDHIYSQEVETTKRRKREASSDNISDGNINLAENTQPSTATRNTPRTFKYYTDSPLFAIGEESGVITVRNYELANAYDKPLYMLKVKIVASDGSVYYDYVKVHIHEANKNPTVNDQVEIDGVEDQEITITDNDLLKSFGDVNTTTIIIDNVIVSSGTIEKNNDGGWLYTPEENFHGDVELNYDVKEGGNHQS